jgi:N-alpha-acetyltransferase 30
MVVLRLLRFPCFPFPVFRFSSRDLGKETHLHPSSNKTEEAVSHNRHNNNIFVKMSQKQAKGAKKHQQQRVDPSDLDAAVRQIESSLETLAEKKGLSKKGMTKAQTVQALEKIQQEELAKLSLGPHGGQTAADARKNHAAAIKSMLLQQEEEKRQQILESKYVNVEQPLPAEYTAWKEVAPRRWIRFEQFDRSNEQMSKVVALYNQELSEPYSSFTYQFFVFGWPDLCIIAFGIEQDAAPNSAEKGTFVGAVVSRASRKGPNQPLRGYVAMLAVHPSFRGARIGSRLVEATVALMKLKGCDEVSLETPVSNQRALKLYTDLGFCKIKFLPVYYLDGSDAFRLKLYLNDFVRAANAEETATEQQQPAAAEEDEGAVPPLEEQH